MTQEVLTALGATAPVGEGNSTIPVGDGLPDVPQTQADARQRANRGVGPYGGDDRIPAVGATFGRPQTPDQTADGGRVIPAPTEPDEDSVGEELSPPADLHPSSTRDGEPFLPQRGRIPTRGQRATFPALLSAKLTGEGEGQIPRQGWYGDEEQTLSLITPSVRTGGASPAGGSTGAAPDAFLRAHFAALCAQGEALGREDPSFDLDAALRDPAFLRLTAPGMGVDVRRAWTALHPETLQRRAAADAGGMLARSLSSGAARPREGGGQTGASLDSDYRRLPRAEQLRLKQRIYNAAALGEKIYP